MTATAEARARFIEGSRELAAELGQTDAPLPAFVHPEAASGILETRVVKSKRSSHLYHLVRTAGGWQHTSTDCPGWLFRGHCWHVEALNMESTALITTNPNALELIDDLDDDEVVAAISGDITKAWAYEFNMGGTKVRGISATGVEEACGELAKHGEVIRVIDIRIEYEDADEARFMVQAARYAVNGSGAQVQLDVTFRGKRQPKFEMANGESRFDKNWYEKGISKAVRNAKGALLPETIKSEVIARALETPGRVRTIEPAPRQQQVAARSTRQLQQPAQQPAPSRQEPQGDAGAALSTFWADCRRSKIEIAAVMDESKRIFQGREPKDLTPAERARLYTSLTQPVGADVPAETALDEASHVHVPYSYDEDGQPVCACGVTYVESTGESI